MSGPALDIRAVGMACNVGLSAPAALLVGQQPLAQRPTHGHGCALADLAADTGKPVKIRYTSNGTTKTADKVQVAAAAAAMPAKAAKKG
jgi:hypothetical protein